MISLNHSALILFSFGIACVVISLFLRQHRYGYFALVVAVVIFFILRKWLG